MIENRKDAEAVSRGLSKKTSFLPLFFFDPQQESRCLPKGSGIHLLHIVVCPVQAFYFGKKQEFFWKNH